MGKESELFLSKLARKSFLTLWSYPNPHNDDGLKKRKEGKELCDLLVVFGSDVIIFSDKSCDYPAMGKGQAADWIKWHRKAVMASVKQIRGAERWLRNLPDRIFADPRCTTSIHLPAGPEIRVHRIVLALGAEDAIREHFHSASGSFPIISKPASEGTTGIFTSLPFAIGGEGNRGEHFHVMDGETLELVMGELDTIVDFVSYLRAKEDFLENVAVTSPGEEELLGLYLKNSDGRGHFFLEAGARPTGVAVDSGYWRSLSQLPQYTFSKEANKPSYAWDNLIEYFTEAWSEGRTEGSLDRRAIEAPLQVMAATSRLKRRALGRLLIEAMRTQKEERRPRFLATADATDPEIAFGAVGIPLIDDTNLDAYRDRRQTIMAVFARSLKIRLPTLTRAVIIGIGTTDSGLGSEDIALVDLTVWSPAIEADTREDMARLGIGAELQTFQELEFPMTAKPPTLAPRRRDPS